MSPIFITFDTNTYSRIVWPQLNRILKKNWPITHAKYKSKAERLARWYLYWCIRCGRIVAAIPEAALAIEAWPKENRIDLICAVGTTKAANPPQINQGRLPLIQDSFALGFRVQHGARIAYGELVGVGANDWAKDKKFDRETRQQRHHAFIRSFNDYALEEIRSFGERLSIAHGLAIQNSHLESTAKLLGISIDRYLWRKGLKAEERHPIHTDSPEGLEKQVNQLFSDWADFDIAATHYAYGYDFLCTEDRGRSSQNSVFNSAFRTRLKSDFDIETITIVALAKLCVKRFGFPIRTWSN